MNNKELVLDAYNSISKVYYENFFSTQEDKRFYDKFISHTKVGFVLDLGCGNGQACHYLSQKGYTVKGYDFSENMINEGKLGHPDLELYVCDIENIPKQKVKANGAIYAYSLFCLSEEQAKNSLTCCNKNLKQNATLMLLLQKGTGEIYMAEPFDKTKTQYLKLYTEEEITNLLINTGFKVKTIELFSEEEDNSVLNEIMCVIATKVKNV